jgi:thiosulfate/3-mercaptopyruvate sulfurtransferase
MALIAPDELRRSPADTVVVDCRFALSDPGAGRRAFEDGHIPGAVFAELARDLSAPPGPRGRHPLPAARDFDAAAARLRIGASTRVVAYDGGEGGAARLWWLLRHFGHRDAAVLDGGLGAWRAAGGAIERGPARAAAAPAEPFVSQPRDDDTISADELREAGGTLVLVDARARERYRGEVETLDPVAGHIPGAHNLPFAEVAPEGRYRPPAALRQLLRDVGVDGGRQAAVYCGSGVTASTLVLASEVAGVAGVRLYPGSWSEWSRRGLPAES